MNKQKQKQQGENIMEEYPLNKPFIISKEVADEIFKDSRSNTELSPEEREQMKQDAEKWFKKPKKKN